MSSSSVFSGPFRSSSEGVGGRPDTSRRCVSVASSFSGIPAPEILATKSPNSCRSTGATRPARSFGIALDAILQRGEGANVLEGRFHDLDFHTAATKQKVNCPAVQERIGGFGQSFGGEPIGVGQVSHLSRSLILALAHGGGQSVELLADALDSLLQAGHMSMRIGRIGKRRRKFCVEWDHFAYLYIRRFNQACLSEEPELVD